MKERIEWTSRDGKPIAVGVELVTSKRINADGQILMVECCELNVIAYHNGMVIGYGEPEQMHAGAVVARIGKLGMVRYNHERVAAAIARAKATPEWRAKEETIKRNVASVAEYERADRAIKAAMSE